MMKKWSLLALLFLCSCSAGTGIRNHEDKVVVDFDATEPTLKVEKIVQLETNKETFFDRFYRVKVTDKYIFVQDQTKIVVFDPTGKYLSKVQKLGHGPQEYLYLTAFCSFQDELYITSSENQGVKVYSLAGEYLRDIPLDFQPDAIQVTDDYMAFKSAYNPGGTLIVTDRQGKKKYETIAPILAKTTVSIPAVFPFTESDGKVYYFPDFSSSVYTVGADTSDVKQITFDFGSHSITPEFVSTLTGGTFIEEFKKHEIVNFPSFYPTRGWWGLVFAMGDQKYRWFYHPQSGKQHILATTDGSTSKLIVATTDSQFVEAVDAAEFLENPRYASHRAGRTVNENDNAVLIFYSVQ